MPSAKLYGRRWHFSTDIVAIPAGLSGLFHAAWIIILLVWAGATGGWPGHCTSHEGAQYAALFGAFLLTSALNLVIDVLLVRHSLQGAPFEASKRRWVVPLLYASTAPLVLQLGLAAWGAYVSTHLQPDCWPLDRRNAVTNLAQGLVFGTLGFLTVAAIGVAITYNAYPQHNDLSSWEARCECVAAMLCCHQNVVRRPDGKRPPLTNIAELTAGLLSHVDLDATDITAALFLASAAQNRRRRLHIAKALLPVYKAIRSGAAGSGTSSEELLSSGEEEGDDDASSTASVNDVPTDAELDRMIAAQQAQRVQQGQLAQRAEQGPAADGAAGHVAEDGPEPPPLQVTPPGTLPKLGRRGKTVSWAEDAFSPAAAAPAAEPAASPSQPQGPPDLAGISLPAPALRQLQREVGQEEGQEEGQGQGQGQEEGQEAGPAAAQVASLGVTQGSLPLTADNVARLDERMTAAEQLAAAQAGGAPPSAEQVQQAEQLLEELPASLPDQEVADQLADAIEAEIRELGGGQLLEEAAAMHLQKSDSLDLAAVQIDPEAPSIWFSTASSRVAAAEGLSSLASGATGQLGTAAEAEAEEAGAEDEAGNGRGDAAVEGDELATVSPFAAAAAAGAAPSTTAESSTAPPETEVGGQPARASAAVPPDPSEPIPPADEAAAAAVAEAAAAAAAAAADSGSPQVRARKAASASGASSVGGTSAAGGSMASSRLQLDKQLTLKYPTVITPSAHMDEFRGPLPAEALTDLYAGRHEGVPGEALREALHFLKYSYAVYSLQPKIEAPSSGVDVIFCCGCMASPIDPQKVVFQGLSELEGLEDEEAIELLHLNCSNRVLAHLPYLIALDHAKRAVVLAIRGTISAADIVTDAIVYPEPLDSWLPEDIKQELSEPAFAHAGMAAAAKAIFEDMTERGILQQLVQDEEVGDFVAPEQQEAQRDGSAGSSSDSGRPHAPAGTGRRQGQYDADAGRDDAGAESYRPSASAGTAGASTTGQRASAGTSAANKQSSQRGDAQGRLWEGTSGGAARPDAEAAMPAGPGSEGTDGQPGPGFQHFSMRQQKRAGRGGQQTEADGEGEMSPGRQVGEIMRRKIANEGWQLIVLGHSLGAGAAALVSLKLRESFPGLKCLAFCCPGGLVSKNLAHAMRRFTTCVVVGKDAVPRATVSNLSRLMDELVTALARCKQPKLKVLPFPWWRHRKEQFRDLFWRYDEIPPEPLAVLQRYHESRTRIGQPLPMYPPGRVIFLRPIKTREHKSWQAVWIGPEDIIAEGLLISPKMYRDHMCSTAYEALTRAAEAASQQEASGGAQEGSRGAAPGSPHVRAAAARGRQDEWRRQRVARHRWQQRLAAQRSGSLQEVLVEAV